MDEAAIGARPAGPRRSRSPLTDFLTPPTFSSRRGLLLCTLLLLAFAGGVRGLPDDADQPIHFRADNVEGDLLAGGLSTSTADDGSPAKRVVATGSVQIDQGSMRLQADRVVIESDGNQITLIDAHGDPARYRQQPQSGAGPLEARAANIVYRPADARIELIGSAWFTRGSDEFRGEVITYEMRQGKVVASGKNEGVEMILQPESARESPQPGSARGNPSHGTNASAERRRPEAVVPWESSGAGPQAEPDVRHSQENGP